MQKRWPENRAVNIVCHGHSVPAGYFATPFVDTFNAYPHLLHRIVKGRFPFAVVNVIVTAVGGENSVQGVERFESDVLGHKPDVITIDYALNDRRVGLDKAKTAWERMIALALSNHAKPILLTPSWDKSFFTKNDDWQSLVKHAEQVRSLASAHGVGLADTFKKFDEYVKTDGDLTALLSHVNHPGAPGHEIIAKEIAKYFMAR